MNESELLGHITNEERAALGYHTGELAGEREEAINYYLQKPFGNEVEGRSQVVDSTVRDTVEWTLPMLLDIFTASGKAVEFEPTGLEDEEAAKQATDACNYVLFKQNNGFLVFYEWFKDALLEKNGVVKFYYEEKETKRKETYYGLTDEQLALLLKDENVEVIAHSEYPDPYMQQANAAMQIMVPPINLHDVQIEVTEEGGKVCVETVPPEQFLITARHDSLTIQDCTFCEHRVRLTQSDLKEMGYKDLDDIGSWDDDFAEISPSYLARRKYTEEQFPEDELHGPSRPVWCREAYIRVDYDEDGVAELRRVFIAGNKILDNEETDHIPFAAISPIPLPHRFIGQSVAETVMDLQLIKSTLWRQILDNLYISNNPRFKVLSTQGGMAYANLDDLLTSRPGGIIREYQPNAVEPLESNFVAGATYPMLEYIDMQRMNRTGVNQLSSGLDADAINKTARGAVLAQNQQTQKVKLIARIFAETGVKDLFKGILRLLNKYKLKPMMIRMDNRFVPVDPRNWNTGWDMTVTVGLGTGDKDQQLVHLQLIAGIQKEMRMAGMSNIVTDQNLYRMAGKIVENAGYKHIEEFFTNPETQPPPPPPQNPEAIKAQTEIQTTQMKLQAEGQKTQLQAALDKMVAEIESQTELAKAQIQAQTDFAIEQMRLRAQSAETDKKIRADAELTVFEANKEATIKQAELEDKDKDRQAKLAVDGGKLGLEDKKLKLEDDKQKAPIQKAKDESKVLSALADATSGIKDSIKSLDKALNTVTETQKDVVKALTKKRVTKAIRDKDGNLIGSESE